MAGIGFELRKIVKRESLLSLMKMYGYAAVLSSGPWVISIVAILVVGFVHAAAHAGGQNAGTAMVVTYTFALAVSLIFTGAVQMPLTRYIADLIYSERTEEILGSFMGALLVVMAAAALCFFPLVWWGLAELSWAEKWFTASLFVVLCGVWVSNILVASLKYYRQTLLAYAVSYGFIVVASLFWTQGYLQAVLVFFGGNTLLLSMMIALIYKSYKGDKLVRFGFFRRKGFYYSLALAGLFYNLGIWVDKFIFWYHPMTGEKVLGIIHASVVYDLPIFLAYLSIIPGMALFFYRLEADFADKYELFFTNVRHGGTLSVIQAYRNQMVDVIRLALKEVIAVEILVMLALYLGAPSLFDALKIPRLYLGLFFVLSAGAFLQLGFMVILALLYYLDRRIKAMWLSLLFFVLNGVLSVASIYAGAEFFGYGYAVSLLVVFGISLVVMRQTMERLDYETFMYQ